MEIRWMTRKNENGEVEKFYPATHAKAIVDLNNKIKEYVDEAIKGMGGGSGSADDLKVNFKESIIINSASFEENSELGLYYKDLGANWIKSTDDINLTLHIYAPEYELDEIYTAIYGDEAITDLSEVYEVPEGSYAFLFMDMIIITYGAEITNITEDYNDITIEKSDNVYMYIPIDSIAEIFPFITLSFDKSDKKPISSINFGQQVTFIMDGTTLYINPIS